MHPFFLVGAVLHATAFAVVGFFVLFAADKIEGFLRVIGYVLGVWLFILALLAIAGGATAVVFGGHPFGLTMAEHMQPSWCPVWMQHHGAVPAIPPAAPAK